MLFKEFYNFDIIKKFFLIKIVEMGDCNINNFLSYGDLLLSFDSDGEY